MNRRERRASKRRKYSAKNQIPISQNIEKNLADLWSSAERYLSLGSPFEALPFLQELVSIEPNNGDFLFNYGACLFETGDFFAASVQLQKALETGLKNHQLLPLLGNSYNKAGLHEDAISTYKYAIETSSGDKDFIDQLWSVIDQLGRYDEAVNYFSYLVEKRGNTSSLDLILGQAFLNLERYEAAELKFSEIISIDKNNKPALQFLATTKLLTGQVNNAIDLYRRASKLADGLDPCQNDYLMSLNYSDRISEEELTKWHNLWADNIINEITPTYNKKHDFSSERKLKLGYISSDFRYHAVANFIKPILEAHNRKNFALVGYYNNWIPDPQTVLFKDLFDQWREIKHLTVAEVCIQIADDNIDVLIDLNGHTTGNSLAVFKKKPAPLQISWLGYPNATGLKEIDFIVGDNIVAPLNLDQKFDERSAPLRLKDGHHCYHQLFESQPTDLPANKNGFVTFGSFNTLAKLSTKTIKLWASVLKSIPDARLIIKRSPLKIEAARNRILNQFKTEGVPNKRILFSWDIKSTADHLKEYSNIDIALDTFPYNGTTTTCDALWMGVPVVTLCGMPRSSRISSSILNQIGLSELIANSSREYIKISVTLANSVGQLREMREQLRSKIINSSLYDNKIVTKQFENAIRHEWKRICERENYVEQYNPKE